MWTTKIFNCTGGATKNTAHENLQNVGKAVVRRKFIAVNAYVKKERSQINALNVHFKELEKKINKPINKPNPEHGEGRKE